MTFKNKRQQMTSTVANFSDQRLIRTVKFSVILFIIQRQYFLWNSKTKKNKKKTKKNFFWNTTTAPAELFPHCSQIKTNDKIRELVVSALIPIYIHRLVAILKENKKNSIA